MDIRVGNGDTWLVSRMYCGRKTTKTGGETVLLRLTPGMQQAFRVLYKKFLAAAQVFTDPSQIEIRLADSSLTTTQPEDLIFSTATSFVNDQWVPNQDMMAGMADLGYSQVPAGILIRMADVQDVSDLHDAYDEALCILCLTEDGVAFQREIPFEGIQSSERFHWDILTGQEEMENA